MPVVPGHIVKQAARRAIAEAVMWKTAQEKLSDEDVAAFREMIRQQKENAKQRELRKQNRFAKNRAERVSAARLALMVALGALGAKTGLHVGRFAGRQLGNEGAGALTGALGLGVAGVLGGRALGTRSGNRLADNMERVENETGVRVNEQSTEMAARAANRLAVLNYMRPSAREKNDSVLSNILLTSALTAH